MEIDAHELWRNLAEGGGRSLSEGQVEGLERYLDLLTAGNEVMNLTRIGDREEARVAHIADALTLLKHIPAGTKLLADVGSGGGIPGVILGIALPEVRVVLIESTQKKARFLDQTAQELGLRNVEVRAIRAEDAAATGENWGGKVTTKRSDLREKCDVVTARAVGAMVYLVEWCLPLARVGGKLLAMKGPRIAEELPAARQAIRILGGGEAVVHEVEGLPGEHGHVICEVPKVSRTNEKYPRPATEAGKGPL